MIRKTHDDVKNEEELEYEKIKGEIFKKALQINEVMDKEAEGRASDSDDDEDSDGSEKWDCESVLSTFTNTDNHPGVIKTIRKIVKPKNKMELHKQFKVPLEGLMPIAEEITIKKEAKKLYDKKGPYEAEEI